MPASNSEEVDIAAEQEAETATATKKKNEPPKKKTQFELMALLNPPKKKEKPKKEEPLERNINHVRMEEAAAAGKNLRMHFSSHTVPTMISAVCAVLSVGENGSHAGNAMAASGVDGATALLQQLKTGADAADDKDANPERRRKAAFKAYEVGSIRLIANGHICAQAYARTHAHTLTHACRRRHTGTRDPADARRESRPEAFADQGAHLSGLAEVARKSTEPGIDAGRLSFRCGLLWGPSLGFNAVPAGIGLA